MPYIDPWTEYDGLLERAAAFKARLESLKDTPPATDRTWYAYDILANLWHLSEHYNLVFFLGILYHLKNPYFALEKLARHSRYCFLSTRVARFAADREVQMHKAPMAYLLDPTECNNDSTNYWIFSPGGVERLVRRTGWKILASYNAGETVDSDPFSQERDERMFMVLESQVS